MEVRILAVAPGFEVRVDRAPRSWSAGQEREIDRLWAREQARHDGALADTTVLAHVAADRRALVGRFVRARDVLAARLAPELFAGAPPAPVEVCALVTLRGRVVLGRRAEHLARWPGCWELVPAGALGPRFHDPHAATLDYAAQVLTELAEHTPLPPPARGDVRPFALAFDGRARVWSLCTAIDLDLDEDAVRRIERTATPTYDAFRVVRPVDVLEAGLWDGDELVPLSSALVRLPRSEARAA